MKRVLCSIWAVAVLCIAPVGFGDTLVLEDNEVFRGTLVRINNGVVVFRPKLAGQMMVAGDTVKSLETEGNLVISLPEDAVLYGRLVTGEEGLQVLPLDGAAPVPIRLADIEQALAIPSAPRTQDDEAYAAWQTTVETGIMTRFGSRSVADAVVRLETEYSGADAGFRGDATVGVPLDGGEVRYVQGRFILHGGDAFGPYGAVDVDRRTEGGLEWRTGLSLGLRRAWDREHGVLETTLGLGAEWEDWRETEGPRPLREAREQSRTDMNLQLGLRYRRAFLNKGAMTSALQVVPSLGQPGEVRALTTAEWRYPLTPRLHLRLDMRLDYDSDKPYRSTEPVEGGIGAGVGLTF